MSEQSKDKTIDVWRNALIGLLYLIVGWGYNVIQKQDERIYEMQTKAMTVTSAEQMEARISRNLEIRMSDLSNRLDLILKLIQSQGNGKQ